MNIDIQGLGGFSDAEQIRIREEIKEASRQKVINECNQCGKITVGVMSQDPLNVKALLNISCQCGKCNTKIHFTL